MRFFDRLTPRAQNAFNRALSDPTDWAHVIWVCLEDGERDLDYLTDVAFHLLHPERGGRPIAVHEEAAITRWKALRWAIKQMMPEEKRPNRDPTLTNWLETIDTTKAPKMSGSGSISYISRLTDVERFRVFMIKASKDPALHNTVFQTFKYTSGLHSGYWAHERSAYVLGFWQVGKQNALQVMKNAIARNRGDLKGIGKAFFQLEMLFFAHVDIATRWARASSTSDGPTMYDEEMRWLRYMVRESKYGSSIYSIYARRLQRTLDFKTDPNPQTAGLPF